MVGGSPSTLVKGSFDPKGIATHRLRTTGLQCRNCLHTQLDHSCRGNVGVQTVMTLLWLYPCTSLKIWRAILLYAYTMAKPFTRLLTLKQNNLFTYTVSPTLTTLLLLLLSQTFHLSSTCAHSLCHFPVH